MEFINATRMAAGCTMGMEPSGRELLIVAVKGTFQIAPHSGERLVLQEEQVPLVMSDVFHGEPASSSPKYEADFALRKSGCDVLLNGCAHAPDGRPTTRVTVGMQIGPWSKTFAVVGERVWFTAGTVRCSDPVPFQQMPISYDYAFGGVDTRHEDPAQHAAFALNPVGRGFHKHLVADWLESSPLPNTEELNVPVTTPDGDYRPMSFGAIGRGWPPRLSFAGTYDQAWLDHQFPFLPVDFDDRYYQSTPPDQQLAIPVGEQVVSLLNLTPDGRRDFVLPHFEAPIHIFPHKGPREDLRAVVDTIIVEPELARVTMTWRVARPLRKNIREIAQVLVGRKGQQWWQKRASGFPIPVVVEPMREPEVS